MLTILLAVPNDDFPGIEPPMAAVDIAYINQTARNHANTGGLIGMISRMEQNIRVSRALSLVTN